MVYKHVIGLKTDSSQSNLGGNTDSNYLISGDLCHFLFAFLLMVIILFCSPRYSAGLSIIYLRFNPATISRPLRTSTSRPFRMSIPRHSMPAFPISYFLSPLLPSLSCAREFRERVSLLLSSIVPDVIRLRAVYLRCSPSLNMPIPA